jgi:uncharacterized protein YabN with tetrapyrrole methylase and pyrophosphatase domain
MTALRKLIDLEIDSRNYGFYWPNHQMILEQAISECKEIKEAIDNNEGPNRIQEEIGDLIHTAISLCLYSGFGIDDTLNVITQKFGERMEALKKLTQEQGLTNLQGQTTPFMLDLWEKVKEMKKEKAA